MPHYKPPLWIAVIFAVCVVLTFFVQFHGLPRNFHGYSMKKVAAGHGWLRTYGQIYDLTDDTLFDRRDDFTDSACALEFAPLDMGGYYFVKESKMTMNVDMIKTNRKMLLVVSSPASGDVFGFGVYVTGGKRSVLLQGGFVASTRAFGVITKCCEGQPRFDQVMLDDCVARKNLSVVDTYGFNPLSPLGMMRLELCLLQGTIFGACFMNHTHQDRYTPMRSVVKMRFNESSVLDDELTWYGMDDTYSLREIPKIIHQTWFGDINVLGPVKKSLMAGCKAMHEAAGWRYMLWTDENIRGLYHNESVTFLINQEWFDNSRSMKNLLSDISRFEILYKYGGVYLDADMECLKPFDQLNADLIASGSDCYAGIEADWKKSGKFSEFTHGLISSAIMGCARHSRTMMAMITGLFYTDRGAAPWISAGPYHFSKLIQDYRLPIMVLPYYFFFPEHHHYRDESIPVGATSEYFLSRGSYTRHHWGTTFNNYNVRR